MHGQHPLQSKNHFTPLIAASLSRGPVAYLELDPFPHDCGAECTFLGKTRAETHPELGELISIDYQVYAHMATQILTQLAHEATDKFTCRAVRIVHATGPVHVAEASVLIQTASPHRQQAFLATRHIIDQLKLSLPIWKQLVYQRGSTYPMGSPPQPLPSSPPNGTATPK